MKTKSHKIALYFVPCNPPDKNIQVGVLNLLNEGFDVLIIPYVSEVEPKPHKAHLATMMALAFGDLFFEHYVGQVFLYSEIMTLNHHDNSQLINPLLKTLNNFPDHRASLVFAADQVDCFKYKISELVRSDHFDFSLVFFGRKGGTKIDLITSDLVDSFTCKDVVSVSDVLFSYTPQQLRDQLACVQGVSSAGTNIPRKVYDHILACRLYGTGDLNTDDIAYPVYEGNAAKVQST